MELLAGPGSGAFGVVVPGAGSGKLAGLVAPAVVVVVTGVLEKQAWVEAAGALSWVFERGLAY